MLAAAASTVVLAQEKTSPRTEYVVELSESALNIGKGESKEITVTFLRSKSFAKSKATLGLSSSLPKGVHVTFDPAEGVGDSSVAKISVDTDAAEGTYHIIISSALQGKKKGSMLTLTVTPGASGAVSRN